MEKKFNRFYSIYYTLFTLNIMHPLYDMCTSNSSTTNVLKNIKKCIKDDYVCLLNIAVASYSSYSTFLFSLDSHSCSLEMPLETPAVSNVNKYLH